MAEITIRSVLGDARRAVLNPGDGHPWFNCPFCTTAVYAEAGPKELGAFVGRHGVCQNPWCLANPAMPLDAARIARGEAILAADAEARRQRDHQAALDRIAAGRAAEAEERANVVAEAKARGACRACALAALRLGRRKFTVHRSGRCPRDAQNGPHS